MREADWTPEEFELLLSRPDLDDQTLASFIQTRSAGAVAAVRGGVHSFHSGDEDTTLLSRMMRDRLITNPRHFACSICEKML